MSDKQKKTLIRILVTAGLFALALVLDKLVLDGRPVWAVLCLYLVPYLVIGYDVVRKAAVNILHGQAFDECFLMTVATVAAFAIGEYPEATAVMLFYQVGELFQSYAVGRSRQSIAQMMSIVPEYANLETDGQVEEVDPEDVAVGSVIVIKAGERVPLDGIVVDGESYLDTSALTGESVPRRVTVGEEIFSGCVNGEQTLRVRTTKAFEDSTVARILDLVENASNKKARLETFITRFARIYTPVVTLSALVLALVPPLVLGGGFGPWIHRACIFLIVSCPCALVISVPLGFFGGIGAASRLGVLVKGGNYLEAIAQADTMIFDKTGTLTQGNFLVTQILPSGDLAAEALLELAAHGEGLSNHPIAQSIRAAYAGDLNLSRLGTVEEVPGKGLSLELDGKPLLVGNARLLEAHGIPWDPIPEAGTVVHVAYDGVYAGALVIADSVKPEAAKALADMKALGVSRTVMLTGDRAETAQAVARELGLDEVYAELLPTDKVAQVEEILALQQKGQTVCFVGDGINDAPVLMRSDVGIAMGSLGSDAAIEAADIVLMDDDVGKIAATVRIGRKTLRIVRENVVFALGVKLLVLVLGALGLANMWQAVFADVGVTVLAILNSMRALRAK